MTGADRRPEDAPPLYAVPDESEDEEEPQDDPDWGREDRDGPEGGQPDDEPGRELAVRDKAEVEPVAEGTIVAPWHGPQKVREIFARWITDPDERRSAVRWWFRYQWHRVAFHGVRLPLYGTRLTVNSPRGVLRAGRSWFCWVTDREAHDLRISAVEGRNVGEYLSLVRERNERVKHRLAISGGVAAAAITAAGWSWYYWPPTPYALLCALVVALGWVGRPIDRAFFVPAVLTSPEAPRLTAEIVARALGALGNAEINKAIKNGPGITFASEVHRDGPGWRADVDLPYGVTAVDIMEKRLELASGLRRPLGCVWPEPAHDEHAGRLVLWVGDQDLSKAKHVPYPLLKRGTISAFDQLPFGTDQRGRPVSITLMYDNMLIGAMPGAGKTFSLRILLLGLMLDAVAELRVFELKGSGDLSPTEKVAHHYASGQDDESIYQCLLSLREVVADLERRAKVIKGLPKDVCPENKVTPELAAKKSLGLHPLVFVIDECQNAFGHEEYGEEIGKLAIKVIRMGRALGVILLLATQRPDKKSLPTAVSALAGLRFCLRMTGQTENDMVLGTSSYKNGLRANIFTINDKGIGYLVGAGDEPIVVKTYYVDNPKADLVAERARILRKRAGTLTGYAAGEETETGPRVSLIEDVAAILQPGELKLWNETALERLAELRPDMYAGWTPGQLTEALKPYGVRTGDTWGRDAGGADRNRKGFTARAVHEAISKIARNPR